MRLRFPTVLLATVLGAAALAPQGASAAVTRTTLAGPSTTLDVNRPVEVDVAPDGTGAVAYLGQVGGVDHVFVSRYVGGAWILPAEQVDSGLPDQTKPSGLPALAVGNGGRVDVVFANGTAGSENLWAVVKPSSGAAFGAPIAVKTAGAFGWTGPNLKLAPNGNGYLTFYGDAGGFHVFADQVVGDTFTPVGSATLNQDAGDQGAFGDSIGAKLGVDATGATGAMAWGESNGSGGTTIWARSLTGATAGPAVDATIPSFKTPTGTAHLNDGGQNNDIDVTEGGGVIWVAQHVSFAYPGGSSRGRTMVSQFTGTAFKPAQEIDGIGDDDDNSEFAKVVVNGSGQGLGVAYRGKSVTIGSETSILSGGIWGPASPVAAPNTAAAARSTAAIDTTGVGAVASYSVPTTGAAPQVVGRVYGGVDDGKISTLSDPTFGDASPPYESGAGSGHAITAFMQKTATGNPRLVAVVTDLPVSTVPTPTPAPTPIPSGCPTSGAGCPGVKGLVPTPVTLTGLKFKTKSFARGTAAPSIVPSTSSKRALSFTVSKAATVTLTIAKATTGRSVSGKCVAATKKNRTKKSCTRYLPQKGKALLQVPAGTTNLSFQGTLTLGKLAATGKYQLSVTADDGAGSTSTPVTASYTLTAAKKKAKKT